MKKISAFLSILSLWSTSIEARSQMSPISSAGRPAPVIPGLLLKTNIFSIIKNDANYRVWRATNGSSYVELASGMNYSKNGQWLPAKEIIEPLLTGGATAQQGQHQVYFPYNIGQGALTMLTPEGQTVTSRPMCISYCDNTNIAIIANLTSSIGEILPSGNKVVYPNAFTALRADLLCAYHKTAYESDVVFRECPASPDNYGIDNDTARLQVWTEFFSTNNPEKSYDFGANTNADDPYLEFNGMRMTHGWAYMLLGTNVDSMANSVKFRVKKTWVALGSRRFLVEEVPYRNIYNLLTNLPPSLVASAGNKIFNNKRHSVSDLAWIPSSPSIETQTNVMEIARTTMPSGQQFVLDYTMINSTSLSGYTFRGDTTYLISGIVSISWQSVFEGGTVIKFANSYSQIYVTQQNGQSELIWQGDALHPVTFTSIDDNSIGQPIGSGSPVVGNNTYLFYVNYNKGMEVKYARFKYAGIGIQTASWLAVWHSQFVNCSQALRPMAYFDPQGTYSGGWMYPYWGVALFNDLFTGCYTVLNLDDGASLNYTYAYPAQGSDLYFTMQNCTIDQVTNLLTLAVPTFTTGCGGCGDCGSCGGGSCGGCGGGCGYEIGCGSYSSGSGNGGCGGSLYYPTYISAYSQALLTNCLFTSVGQNVQTYLVNTIGSGSGVRGYNNGTSYPYAGLNYGCAFGGGNVVQLNSGSASPYQTAGAGNYYLPSGSPYKTFASQSVQSNLFRDLQKKTTDVPMVYTSTTWSNASFVLPQAVLRDVNLISIGYHYEPIDYLLCDLSLTNASILVTNGAMLGYENGSGIILKGGAQLAIQGTPDQRSGFIHYNSIQEQSITLGLNAVSAAQAIGSDYSGENTAPTVKMRLTTVVAPNGATNVFYQPGGNRSLGALSLQDCEIYGAGANVILMPASDNTVTLDNNLFQYCNTLIGSNGQVNAWNNLFTAPYFNSAYKTLFTNSSASSSWALTDNAFDNTTVYLKGICGNNAYLNFIVAKSTKQATDLTVNSFSWQSGSLGGYYQPASSSLIDHGSRTADLAGLYHYTTQTNQVKETNSIVDIGYHYVATDAYANPLDTDGDRISDYLEDSNGNGVSDVGDLGDWLISPYNGLSRSKVLTVFTPLK